MTSGMDAVISHQNERSNEVTAINALCRRCFCIGIATIAVSGVLGADLPWLLEGSTNRVAASTGESSIYEGLSVVDCTRQEMLLEDLERAEWTSDVSEAVELRLRFNFYMIIR